MAGWLGDATITNKDTGLTSFDNADYCADLDAENIYRYIIQGKSSVYAINLYYSELSILSTRADKFKTYIDYNYVEEKVCEKMAKDSYSKLSKARKSGDKERIRECENALYLELSSNYPDTYNFLCSLRAGYAYLFQFS